MARSCFVAWGLILLCLVFAGRNAVAGDEETTRGIMQQHFEEFRRAWDSGTLTLPFALESVNNASDSKASIRYFLRDVDYGEFRARLGQPEEWCEFIPLHLNIKACAYLEQYGGTRLRFYAGIKGYVTPDKAHLLELSFRTGMINDVYVVKLFAQDGPLDSSEINFTIRAIDVAETGWDGIYLEFDVASKPGLAANLARLYLATIARNKIGFSVDGKTWTGNPAYVTGQRGATERNIVRYLLAIETYFDTLDLPPQERFFERLQRWFDATEQYHEQLHELDRQSYIDNKIRERENQLTLQAALDNGEAPDFTPVDRRR